MKRPNTCTNLIRAIKRIAGPADEVRLSRSLANVIVGQLLPDGVVKGGSSLMFRYGAACTRYTRDEDLRVVISSSLRDVLSSQTYADHFARYEGVPIRLPTRARPTQHFLDWHRHFTFIP